MNYYPFHIGDYLSATRHLSWEEDAAYRRLLDTYYTTEKALPLDLRSVCRLVLATTESQREAVEVVLNEFFQHTENGWINGRADAEIHAMRDKQQKQRDKANAMWDKRRAASGNATHQSTAMPRHEQSDATASKDDADAMPPTPTPTPTPTPIIIGDAPPKAVATQQGTRLQADWVLPDEWRQWAESERPDLDATKVSERFRDFWIAKPGKDGRKLDWLATWRNWVRSQSPGQHRPSPTLKPGSDEYMQAHKNASWWRDAGFSSVYEAANKRCWHHNAKDFADGARKETA